MGNRSFARSVAAAGLGLAITLGALAPTAALADSAGRTNLYVTAEDDDITAPEGAQGANIRVTIPVAISYVADTEGNLVGPDDDTVLIANNSDAFDVHVSSIHVVPEEGVTVSGSRSVSGADEVYLEMMPDAGTLVPLSDYLEEKAPKAGDWDVAMRGCLALNHLTGRIGRFDRLDPSIKSKLATVHWTVAPGTAEQAASSASMVTIHRVTPNNDMDDLVVERSATSTALGGDGLAWTTEGGDEVQTVGDVLAKAPEGATEVTVYGQR
ncbi:MAG: hypothetical protein UHS51_02860 [Atopobiaceae bacterium]|nr:hypothetical protein [Atopobiaceae bacterium]